MWLPDISSTSALTNTVHVDKIVH